MNIKKNIRRIDPFAAACIVALVLAISASAFILSNANKTRTINRTITTPEGIEKPVIVMKPSGFYEYNGHRYIAFEDHFGLVHDPDCPLCNKNK